MGALLSVLRLVALLATAYVLLNVLKNYVTQSPLDNIPGPPSAHWMKGAEHVSYSLHTSSDARYREPGPVVQSCRVGLHAWPWPQVRIGCQVAWHVRGEEPLSAIVFVALTTSADKTIVRV